MFLTTKTILKLRMDTQRFPSIKRQYMFVSTYDLGIDRTQYIASSTRFWSL